MIVLVSKNSQEDTYKYLGKYERDRAQHADG